MCLHKSLQSSSNYLYQWQSSYNARAFRLAVEDEQELVGTLCENNLITSVHFYDALNTAVSNAKCTGDLSYPISFLTKRPHFVLYRYTYPWPSQFLSLCLGPSKACLDALLGAEPRRAHEIEHDAAQPGGPLGRRQTEIVDAILALPGHDRDGNGPRGRVARGLFHDLEGFGSPFGS